MNKSRLLGTVCAVLFTFITVSANAAFLGRLPATSGGTDYQAYYDVQLDITWLANADAAKGSIYDDGESPTDGYMTLASAMAWLDNLNINGVSGWRLPDMDINRDAIVVNCRRDPPACNDNEMGYVYWEEGITSSTPLPFTNIHNGLYWSGTEYSAERMWTFDMYGGDRDTDDKGFDLHTWAVRDGDVPAVVDDTATVAPDVEIGDGSTVGANTVINKGVSVGEGSTIGNNVTINKDIQLGDNTVVGDGSTINKDVIAGDDLTVGANVTIHKDVMIGTGVIIGDNTEIHMGTMIGKDVTIGQIGDGAGIPEGAGVFIGKDVNISSGAVILDGDTISNGTMITP